MADRLEVADVTCPASIVPGNAVEVSLNFPVGIVRKITIVIPDGHSGLTGLALGYGHSAVIPYKQPAFISGNDEVIPLEIRDKVPGVPWSVFLCNLDLQSHVWEVRFEYDELPTQPQASVSQLLSSTDILNAAATISGT